MLLSACQKTQSVVKSLLMTNEQISQQYYDKMTKTPVVKLVLQLGLPTTVTMLISGIYNMADTYFVGTLGESAQGAIGILFTLQSLIQAVAFMLGHGSGAYVSKELANRDSKEGRSSLSRQQNTFRRHFLQVAFSDCCSALSGLSVLNRLCVCLARLTPFCPTQKTTECGYLQVVRL